MEWFKSQILSYLIENLTPDDYSFESYEEILELYRPDPIPLTQLKPFVSGELKTLFLWTHEENETYILFFYQPISDEKMLEVFSFPTKNQNIYHYFVAQTQLLQ